MFYMNKDSFADEKIINRLNNEIRSESKNKIVTNMVFDMDSKLKESLNKINFKLKLLRFKIRACKDIMHTPVIINLGVSTENSYDDYKIVVELTKDPFATSSFLNGKFTKNKAIVIYEGSLDRENEFVTSMAHEIGHILVYDGAFQKFLRIKRLKRYGHPKYHYQKHDETLCDLFALMVCRNYKKFKDGQILCPGIALDDYESRRDQFDYLFDREHPEITEIYGVTKENANYVNVNISHSVNIYSPYPYSITG